LGRRWPYTRLAQVAYDASPGIINVTGVTLNGGTADLAATAQQIVKWTSRGGELMATGDTSDITARLKGALPARWFGDTAPIRDALLTGWATAHSFLYSLYLYAKLQTRILTRARRLAGCDRGRLLRRRACCASRTRPTRASAPRSSPTCFARRARAPRSPRCSRR
jgi:hypothetical protein